MAKTNDRIEAMSEGQRAYEAKRAAKAGVSLEKWVSTREREKQAEARRAAPMEPRVQKRPGLFRRMLGRLFRSKPR